jgi:SAM-dependent methyltransferase
MTFKDYFSSQSNGYSRFRPRYPRELFAFVAGAAERRAHAWDCGTGSGQAAVALAEWFDRVTATDASQSQLSNAEAHPRVTYLLAQAECCPLETRSVDLVTVAQALHWFDLPTFYSEVRRVSRTGGVLAAWCYGLATVDAAIDRVVHHLYEDILGAYWPPERHAIELQYAAIEFPFVELAAPEFAIVEDWTCDDLLGYLNTWSSAEQYKKQNGVDPVAQIAPELRRAWGPQERRQIQWRIYMRIGRMK